MELDTHLILQAMHHTQQATLAMDRLAVVQRVVKRAAALVAHAVHAIPALTIWADLIWVVDLETVEPTAFQVPTSPIDQRPTAWKAQIRLTEPTEPTRATATEVLVLRIVVD